MEKKDQNRMHEVMLCVTNLPEQLIKFHGQENMLEFLLHTLCQKSCFNFSKAAYFVDNPDFDHLKGVAGFHHPEKYEHNHWDDPHTFSEHMKQAPFNNQVREIIRASIKRNKHEEKEVINELSKELAFNNVNYLSWPIKYNNHGLLVFETEEDHHEEVKGQMQCGLHLLGFCPVF